LHFKPWNKWRSDNTPDWWRQHKNVKHQRSDFYHQANLKNVLEALAALYIVNIYLHYVASKEHSTFVFSVSDTIN